MQTANTPVLQSAALPRVSRIVSAAVTTLVAWDAMSRSRKGLGRLDAHLLRDIGLDAPTAQAQAARPFWRG